MNRLLQLPAQCKFCVLSLTNSENSSLTNRLNFRATGADCSEAVLVTDGQWLTEILLLNI